MRAISFSVALVLAAFLLTSVTAEVPDNSPPPGKVDQSPIGEFLPLAKELIESTEQLITHDDGFGGASVSEVQNNLYLYRFGFENTANNDERVADDFTINNPEGWFIETITFFAYEAYGQCDEGYGQEVVRTGNSAAASKSMPSLNLQIWNGPPNDDTSQVVWGDMSSNCLVSSSSSNIYRVDPYYHEDTSRLIMENVCDVNVTLGPGTYWLDWQTSTSDPETMEVCAPPITILGETGSPDANALQFITGAWIPVIDGDGYYYYYDEYPQGFPFVIEGSIICETLPAPTVKSVGGTSCGGNPSDTSPRLEWYDVLWDEGYEWQVRGASGKIVSRGATGKNRNFAAVDELEDGAYTARVKVRGDGVYFCNSNWGPDCPFTIGEVVGPGEEPVDFEWWPYQPKQGQQVRFADLTGGTPISWFWDFGDGWTSDQHHPSHVFDTAGEYTVTRRPSQWPATWNAVTQCAKVRKPRGLAPPTVRCRPTRLGGPAAATGVQPFRQQRVGSAVQMARRGIPRAGFTTLARSRPGSSSSTPLETRHRYSKLGRSISSLAIPSIGTISSKTSFTALEVARCGSIQRCR